eukprot:TRINITY_DN8082_c0_g1_i1.p1 TRINITY_DN8082_c0_g1~~TRINITY_DN8082_c0_g1_i1.p1  ORF type:complete len:592 (+),score=87.32 TRINITY_DN8082_c0_g1_i1:204-1979(+)
MLKATIAKWVSACEAYKNGSYNEAITSFKALDPNSKILFNIGLSYSRLNQHNEAIRSYSQALQADPWLAVAYFARGCSFHLMGDSKNSSADMDDAIDRLRGHENIDYKQLGLDFQLLLCEIYVNKYIASGQRDDSLLREARLCKMFRGGDRSMLDDKCDSLLKGAKNVTLFMVEQLFVPPTIGKGGGGGGRGGGDAKPADAGKGGGGRPDDKKESTARSSDARPSEERPKETTIRRGEDERTRNILGGGNDDRRAPSLPSRDIPSVPSRTVPALPSRDVPSVPSRTAPSVPSRDNPRESKALPAVPGKTSPASGARPLTVGNGSPDMLTLRCFYQDRRLVQLPRQGPTLELLKERVYQKFGMSGLNMRYKTSSGSTSPLNTQRDLMNAIEDGMQEIYLGYDGEVNEFEPKTQTPSRSTGRDDYSSKSTASSTTSTPKYGSAATPNPFLKQTAATTTTAKPAYGSKASESSQSSTSSYSTGKSTASSYTNGSDRGYNSSASKSDYSNGKSSYGSARDDRSKTSSSDVEMIGDWQVCYTDEGEKYYYNVKTNASSWESPDSEPSPPWQVCYTDDNEKYYYNPDTNTSVWDFPG